VGAAITGNKDDGQPFVGRTLDLMVSRDRVCVDEGGPAE
jgi:hypothetical protein